MSYSRTMHQEVGDPTRPAIRYRRHIPSRGPSGLAIFGLSTGVVIYGFILFGQGAVERQELERERVWSRIYLTPLLQAEADRDLYRRQKASEKREALIMKDVPGWKVGTKSLYNTNSYVRPSVVN